MRNKLQSNPRDTNCLRKGVHFTNLVSLARQDANLIDEVETVNGTVRVEWISYWQLASVFSPISPFWFIIILIILVLVYLQRKKGMPIVEFV
jgi:hypothetical protein